jgi:hypothetical protein
VVEEAEGIVRAEDLAEMDRRLEEIHFISERGYEPAYVCGKLLWVKSHWGSVHSHQEALQEIARDQGRTAA